MSEITASVPSTKEAAWFDDFIARLRSHELQLETNTASPELKNFYETIFNNDPEELYKLNRAHVQKYFVTRIVYDYIKELKSNLPLKLAFDFSDSEVLVWAVINDNDWEMERHLLRTEAVVNARFHEVGFDLEATIVEKGDELSVPNHYTPYKV